MPRSDPPRDHADLQSVILVDDAQGRALARPCQGDLPWAHVAVGPTISTCRLAAPISNLAVFALVEHVDPQR